MITSIIYVVIALILLFVIYIMIKAIKRGIEAKNRNKSKKWFINNGMSITN